MFVKSTVSNSTGLFLSTVDTIPLTDTHTFAKDESQNQLRSPETQLAHHQPLSFLLDDEAGAHLGDGVRLLDVLVHRTPVGEDPLAVRARKLLSVVEALPVRLQVALAPEALSALGAVVHLGDAGVLLLAVAEERAFALEDLAAVRARQLAQRPVVLLVVRGYLVRRDDLVAQAADVELRPGVASAHGYDVVRGRGGGDAAAGGRAVGGGRVRLALPARRRLDLDGRGRATVAHFHLGHIHELVYDAARATVAR